MYGTVVALVLVPAQGKGKSKVPYRKYNIFHANLRYAIYDISMRRKHEFLNVLA